jgi:ribosomal-protein-serine acetyltransferase
MGREMRTELTSGDITIVRCRPEDADELFGAAMESAAELSPWMPWFHDAYSKSDTESWLGTIDDMWDKGAEYNFAVVDARSGEYLGGTGVNRINMPYLRGEVGYWVRTGRTGRGIAPAAARLAARFAFEDLGFQRVEIIVAAGNEKSLRVAAKLGATREGVLRNYYRLHGVQHDAIMFSLLPGEI